MPVSDLHFGVTEGGFMWSSRSIRRLPKQYEGASLQNMPSMQAAFLAVQVGQARKQRTEANGAEAGDEREQQAEVPTQQGAAESELPFPGHLLPGHAVLQ